jgi:hypothetical protein
MQCLWFQRFIETECCSTYRFSAFGQLSEANQRLQKFSFQGQVEANHENCRRYSVATRRPLVFTDSFNSLISLSISCKAIQMVIANAVVRASMSFVCIELSLNNRKKFDQRSEHTAQAHAPTKIEKRQSL